MRKIARADCSSAERAKRVFSIVYLLFMCARAIFTPFISVFLQEKGLTAKGIGALTGINALLIVLCQPLWGLVSDRLRGARKTLVLCVFGQAVASVLLPGASAFWPLAVCFSAFTICSAAEVSLIDLWGLQTVKAAGDDKALGQIKIMGACGYALLSALSGLFIARFTTNAILPVCAGMLFLIAGIISRARDSTRTARARITKADARAMLRDRRFLSFLLFAFFMQIAHRASYTFYPLLIVRLGGDLSVVGYAGGMMFVSEALMLLVSKRLLAKAQPIRLILFSSVSFMLWHTLILLSATPYQIMLTCLLNGPSFSLFTFAAVYYLDAIAPQNLRATYQTVAYAVYFGLSGFAGNLISGFVIQNIGYQALYLCGIALTGLSAIGYTLLLRSSRKENNA